MLHKQIQEVNTVNTTYIVCCFISYYDQQTHNQLTNYHTPPTYFDTVVSYPGSS